MLRISKLSLIIRVTSAVSGMRALNFDKSAQDVICTKKNKE